jgi:hypothetical protein
MLITNITKIKFNKSVKKLISNNGTGNLITLQYFDARTESMLKFLDLESFDNLSDASVYEHYATLYSEDSNEDS